MIMIRSFTAALVFVAAIISTVVAETVNTDVSRIIDISSHVVKIRVDIKASGVSGNYELALPTMQARNLSYLNVKSGKNVLTVSQPEEDGEYTIYPVKVIGSEQTLRVRMHFTDMLVPYPYEIRQNEDQFVKYIDSHYFPSPYFTESQTTTVKLGSSAIESYTSLRPSSMKGEGISLGPYTEITPYKDSPFVVHYKNNAPFATITNCLREIEISHWGNIAVEELYDLEHTGAKLKGGFSRFEYQLRVQRGGGSTRGPSFTSLEATLPAEARDLYYRDKIGNISTSTVHHDLTTTSLNVRFRYPIFGGWTITWYQGYNLPTEAGLSFAHDDQGGLYTLQMPFGVPYLGVHTRDLEVKVILPEGATAIESDVPFEVEERRTKRYTFLDSEYLGGRPVVILRRSNLVKEHNTMFTVQYRFNGGSRMFQEPLILVGAYFALFMIVMAAVRVDLSMKTKADRESQAGGSSSGSGGNSARAKAE